VGVDKFAIGDASAPELLFATFVEGFGFEIIQQGMCRMIYEF
jgi:hypothetical protein